jgi:hypothetical protein
MKISKVPSDRGHYFVSSSEDFNQINPIDYYADIHISIRILLEREILIAKKPPVTLKAMEAFLYKRALHEWGIELEKMLKVSVPENFILLLTSESKKEQVRLLKDQSLTPEQLSSFLIKAYLNHGYLLSQFSREHLHNGLENVKLPTVIHIDGENVRKVGDTLLTDGQLTQLIKHRKVVVVKFLDNGTNWHCFFLTYKSISGKESWKNGQPHFHYISDKFGITREKVEESLKSKYYKLGALPHIDFKGYRDDKNDSYSITP